MELERKAILRSAFEPTDTDLNDGTSLDEFQLLRWHERALYTHDADGRLLRMNEPNGTRAAPRFYLGRCIHGIVSTFRHDLPVALIRSLSELTADETRDDGTAEEPRHKEAYVRLLAAHAPIGEVWSGPAYVFGPTRESAQDVVDVSISNVAVLRGGFDAWLGDVSDWQPFVAVLSGGRAVSVCQSVRITPQAHEAGVETLAAFRERGYAAHVVTAWAQRVRERGATPMYSTSWTNLASRALARHLGLVQFAVDFHVD